MSEEFVGRHDNLRKRTKLFALEVIKAVESLPRSRTTDVIGKQLLRSGTSVGANYRAASRAKSLADFISKMGNVQEEADESVYWMELLLESGVSEGDLLTRLAGEAGELVAIAVSSIKTAKSKQA